MRKVLEVIKKHWIIIWLSVAIILVGSFATYAAYTEIASIKRVVSTQTTPGEMFSSNCMQTEIFNLRLTTSEYIVTVCNFDQSKPTMYNPLSIAYVLSAEIMVKRGDDYYTMAEFKTEYASEYAAYVAKAANYSICKTYDDENPSTLLSNTPIVFSEENGFTVTFDSDTLAPAKSSVDRYNVAIDSDAISDTDTDIYVHVWAVPSEPASLRRIDGRLYGATVTIEKASWTGTMMESDCATVDYDFYNYIITGSGSGTIDILWNPDKFEINPFFFVDSNNDFKNDNNTPTTIAAENASYGGQYAGWKMVTIEVDSTVKSMYEMQLYKTDNTGTSYTGENVASGFIKCVFTSD
ncbi:MAG: hypothetical protein K6F14_08065 [Clostridiales bacterium]|nr:hypothetical protein [Clostridiales bacterium]